MQRHEPFDRARYANSSSATFSLNARYQSLFVKSVPSGSDGLGTLIAE